MLGIDVQVDVPGHVSTDMNELRSLVARSKHLLILTGAGVSAESGIPTFRGAGGFWRKYESQSLATPQAFRFHPSLVWEFYHYRRELVLTKKPNKAHIAIAEAENRFDSEGRKVTVITQNVDGLHQQAGSKNVIDLHGSLFKTRCTSCKHVEVNTNSPICSALAGKGAPDVDSDGSDIPVADLPHCKQSNCSGLLRPHIVWFGESLDSNVLAQAQQALDESDLCFVIGTSSIVYPASSYAPYLAGKGVPVAEFNLETTPSTELLRYHFRGPCSTTVPEALTPL